MKAKLICRELSVKKSHIQGYGVFAEQSIEKDDIIEECYSLNIQGYGQGLGDHLFNGGNNNAILPLGYGAIYNHSTEPNATYVFDQERFLMVFTATRAIKKGEEILIYYGDNWFGERAVPVKEPSFKYKFKQYVNFAWFLARFAIIMGCLFTLLVFLNVHKF